MSLQGLLPCVSIIELKCVTKHVPHNGQFFMFSINSQLCHQRALFKFQHTFSINGHLVQKNDVLISERRSSYNIIKQNAPGGSNFSFLPQYYDLTLNNWQPWLISDLHYFGIVIRLPLHALFDRTDELPKFQYWLFNTVTGATGYLATLVVILIFTFAIQYARRHVYRAFWFTHRLYPLLYFLLVCHTTYSK